MTKNDAPKERFIGLDDSMQIYIMLKKRAWGKYWLKMYASTVMENIITNFGSAAHAQSLLSHVRFVFVYRYCKTGIKLVPWVKISVEAS